tara:strand:+ start:47 stop:358 length:312 start_codon:yes stop_codon:yes gene_type:complete
MTIVNYSCILEDEIRGVDYNSDDAKTILNNENIKIYLFLINNIKNNIEYPYHLNNIELNFYINKLRFLKKLVRSTNLIKKHQRMLIKNINNYLRYLNFDEYDI